jgi:hypothetical protein
MLDAPDRSSPRFPADQVLRVRREINAVMARWDLGPDTILICGGARGADILAAEAAYDRGATIRLCLALPPDEFRARSVAIAGTDWADRFDSLMRISEVSVLDEHPRADGRGDVFALTNDWILQSARDLYDERVHAIVVWNGKGGDGPGGTADFVKKLDFDPADGTVAVIDPTRRVYENRQTAAGPKKLLALDGGGIRGALSLQILAAIEAQLRDRYGDDLVLADYFDYIAGTSTGAIIATGLALGKPVSYLQDAYDTLGAAVFKRRFLLQRWRSIYKNGLTSQLNTIFGESLTLGDPEIRTLLLVVLHNTHTDSPWPLSNCTTAKYNRADRYLQRTSDRNLDLSLTTVIRGSTAAPLFFPPETIDVGKHTFVFQDGGITPYNNPALILALMATLPDYGLGWSTGPEKLLLVSVGTGASAAIHPRIAAAKINALFNARNLPSVFMNGASISQDLLCRCIGRCIAGPLIDREVNTRIGADSLGGRPLFTYLRYDADLSTDALIKAGITNPRAQTQVRKLDSLKSLPFLRNLGDRVAQTINVDQHFAGFLPPR